MYINKDKVFKEGVLNRKRILKRNASSLKNEVEKNHGKPLHWRWNGRQQNVMAIWILQKLERKHRKQKVSHDKKLLQVSWPRTRQFKWPATRTMHQGKSAINRFRWDWRPCCSGPHGMKFPADNTEGAIIVGIICWLSLSGSGGHLGEGRNRQESTCWAG